MKSFHCFAFHLIEKNKKMRKTPALFVVDTQVSFMLCFLVVHISRWPSMWPV